MNDNSKQETSVRFSAHITPESRKFLDEGNLEINGGRSSRLNGLIERITGVLAHVNTFPGITTEELNRLGQANLNFGGKGNWLESWAHVQAEQMEAENPGLDIEAEDPLLASILRMSPLEIFAAEEKIGRHVNMKVLSESTLGPDLRVLNYHVSAGNHEEMMKEKKRLANESWVSPKPRKP